MADWRDPIDDVGFANTIQKFRAQLRKARENAADDEEVLVSLQRMVEVADFAERAVKLVNPSLVPRSSASTVNAAFEKARTEVGAYLSDSNLARLETAHTHLDAGIAGISTFPRIKEVDDAEGVRKAIVSFRRSASQHLRRLKDGIKEQEGRLRELRGRVEAQEAEVGQEKARLDKAIQDFVSRGAELEERRSSEYSALLSETREKIRALGDAFEDTASEAVERWGGNVDEKVATWNTEATAYLQNLEEQLRRAEEVVGVIANTGMAGGYQQSADEERKDANRWRLVAAASMVGIIIVALGSLLGWFGTTDDPAALVTKIFSSLTFGILAAYAGREAGTHRRREQFARKVQLELASLDAYLTSLPKTEQDVIKAALADRLFGQPIPGSGGEDVAPPTSILEVLKLARGG